MLPASGFCTKVAMDVVSALGVELIIFVLTIFFFLISRIASDSLAARIAKAKTARGNAVANNTAVKMSSSSVSSSEDEGDVCRRQQQSRRHPQMRSVQNQSCHHQQPDVRRQQQQQQQSRRQPQMRSVRHQSCRQQQPCQLLDKMVTMMRNHPTMASDIQALKVYENLRLCIGLGNAGEVAIDVFQEAARCAKQNVSNLYLTIMRCAVRSKQYHLVEQLIIDMRALSVPRSLHFYESAMKKLASQREFALALNTYDHMMVDGISPSAVTYSCLICFAAEVGDNRRAIQFFKILSNVSVPSIRAYMTVLRINAQLKNWVASASLIQDMRSRGVQVDTLALNTVLATGIEVDKLQEAEDLLTEVVSSDPSIADVVSYNILLKGYSRRGDSQAAFRCKARMDEQGICPSIITFNTLISALVNDQKLEQAMVMLQDMRRNGFHPDGITCSVMVKGLTVGSGKEYLKSCLDLLIEAREACNDGIKSALYHVIFQVAAQTSDDLVLMQIVAQMRQDQVKPNASVTRKLRERAKVVSR